jgi:hypothetical protein
MTDTTTTASNPDRPALVAAIGAAIAAAIAAAADNEDPPAPEPFDQDDPAKYLRRAIAKAASRYPACVDHLSPLADALRAVTGR